jgi:hypothetical protein
LPVDAEHSYRRKDPEGATMESLRLARHSTTAEIICCRCESESGRWDRIAGKAYCPDCQESIVVGHARPLVERTEKNCCVACGKLGTICYISFPLAQNTRIEMDLCPEHLRNLLGRRLGQSAYHQIRRQLQAVGITVEEVFLLHGAFYDANGRALQPAAEPE